MNSKLLPIGSVVLLTGSKKRVMIAGVCQKNASNPESIWDYAGVLYPEGYLSGDKMFMFNREQIETVYALGYQDQEQFAFNEAAEKLLKELRNE